VNAAGSAAPFPERSPAADAEIVFALAQRDIRMRFGEDRFAYLAAFIAPLVWVAATYMAFWLFARDAPVYTDIVTFIISGLFPYATFRFTVTAIGRSRAIARDLLVYPTVQRWHAVTATAVVELVNSLVFVALVMAANYLIFGNGQMARPFEFLGGLLLCWGLGIGYGYLFVNLTLIHRTWWNVGQAILRPSFFISAVFFTANELPERLYAFLGWNPLLHAIETTREAMLVHYQSRVAAPEYVLVWIAALFIAGLVVSRLRRD
jgi:capsular polysaccharide transport system permease protein